MSFTTIRNCVANSGVHQRTFNVSAKRSDDEPLIEEDILFIGEWAKLRQHDPLDVALLRLGTVIRDSLVNHSAVEQLYISQILTKLRQHYFQDDLPGMRLQPTLVPRQINEDVWVTYTIFEQR